MIRLRLEALVRICAFETDLTMLYLRLGSPITFKFVLLTVLVLFLSMVEFLLLLWRKAFGLTSKERLLLGVASLIRPAPSSTKPLPMLGVFLTWAKDGAMTVVDISE